MTQDRLNKIWNDNKSGIPTGYPAIDHGDIHTIQEPNKPFRLWARKAPDGDWKEVPLIGYGDGE